MKNRKSNRLRNYDYSRNNLYFVTICVQDRICCLGSINVRKGRNPFSNSNRDLSPSPNEPTQKTTNLNSYGTIVEDRIKWLEDQYKYVVIRNYVVMPNHVHLILQIDNQRLKDEDVKIKSLSSLIGAFKTTSSKAIHESGFLKFTWQRSFYDHIIKNDKSYKNISNYIDANPDKWHQDMFYFENKTT